MQANCRVRNDKDSELAMTVITNLTKALKDYNKKMGDNTIVNVSIFGYYKINYLLVSFSLKFGNTLKARFQI